MNIRTLSLALLFLTLSVCDALIVHYTATRLQMSNNSTEQKGYVSCRCYGIPKTMMIFDTDMENVFWSMQHTPFCGPDLPEGVCFLLKECDDCSAGMELCSSNQSGGKDCLKRKIELRRDHRNSYEEDYEGAQAKKVSHGKMELLRDHRNSYEGSLGVLKRDIRQTKICRYPQGMENGDMIITEFPNSITISQKCIFGYTLEEGISREMRCNNAENQWKPKRFEECRPFIDCTIDMVSTGFATCVTATTKLAPTCTLSCERYEDKPELPEATYTCKIDGTWEPHLPYCARPGSGIHLVQAPRIKVHPNEAVAVNQAGKKTRKLLANTKRPKRAEI